MYIWYLYWTKDCDSFTKVSSKSLHFLRQHKKVLHGGDTVSLAPVPHAYLLDTGLRQI